MNHPITKTAIITGASSGIGLAITRHFAKAGYSLALTGLEASGHELVKMLTQEYGVRAMFREIDLREPAQIQSFAAEASRELGTISVLVNNAGIQHVASVENFPVQKWNDVLAVNLSAVFHLSQALWPAMKEQRFGRIINIASVHGLVASESKSAYVAAKHGVVGLTKVMALEGAPFGITANSICPGWVNTPLVEKQIVDQMSLKQAPREEIVSNVLLQKQAVKDFVPMELIAETCLFMASEGARLMTGVSLPLDGGWVVQ